MEILILENIAIDDEQTGHIGMTKTRLILKIHRGMIHENVCLL